MKPRKIRIAKYYQRLLIEYAPIGQAPREILITVDLLLRNSIQIQEGDKLREVDLDKMPLIKHGKVKA